MAEKGWSEPELPHKGWTCTGMEDLGDLSGACEMCGTEIRYQHFLAHPEWPTEICVGCVCAERLESDYEAPRRRERELKRRWRRSPAGKYRNVIVEGEPIKIVLCPTAVYPNPRGPLLPKRTIKVRITNERSGEVFETQVATEAKAFRFAVTAVKQLRHAYSTGLLSHTDGQGAA